MSTRQKIVIIFIILHSFLLYADSKVDIAFNNLKNDEIRWDFGRALTYLLANYNKN